MRLPIIFTLITLLFITAPSPAADPSDMAITIHPTAISADELAELLGAYVWKFDASVPAIAKNFSVTLQQSTKGGSTAQFGPGASGILADGFNHEILIAIVPINGTLSDAGKVRVTLDAFGTQASNTTDNPFKTLGIGKPQRPEIVGNGIFNLIGGYGNATITMPVSTADVFVSLKIETR